MLLFSLVFCTLISTVAAHFKRQHNATYMANASISEQCSLEYSTQCYGGDIRDAGYVSSASDCCNLCSQTAGCRFFTWNKGIDRHCWLKRDCSDKRTGDSRYETGSVGSNPSPSPPPPPPPPPSPSPAPSPIPPGPPGPEPNPPNWPSSVHVFNPSMSSYEIKAIVDAAYGKNGGRYPANHGQFSDERYAFLFKAGSYDVDVPIGYYTQALGLGATPQDVVFTSYKGVYSEPSNPGQSGALCTFWRSAENFHQRNMEWAVSQAAPLRRVQVDGNLALAANGYSSGGFFANVKAGSVNAGSQQQWFCRDSTIGGWSGGAWNMVFTGVDGAPQTQCGKFYNEEHTPVIAEKPFIVFENGKYSLKVPGLKTNSHGADHGTSGMTTIPFDKVYVASPADSAATINNKLRSGLHVVLAPGIYNLDVPLTLSHSGQVLLGLGLATLVPTQKNTLIRVGDVDGVRIAGLLLQAGPSYWNGAMPEELLVWGTGKPGNSANPGMLSDVFARVGGPDKHPVATEAMVVLNNGNVIIDNTWLWRADHAIVGVDYDYNRVNHGLVVAKTATDVTTYGLAVEHTLQDLTLWSGNRGQVFFYQSELPYVVSQQQFGDQGYAGFKVTDDVTDFNGYGVGVYSYFRLHYVDVKSGIVVPAALESNFHNSLTVHLNGQGRIDHVLNYKGSAATQNGRPQHLC